MEVRALSTSRILRNLTGYLPIMIAAAAFWCLVLAAGPSLLLRRWMNKDTAGLTAILAATPVAILGLILYIRFVGKRLSRCRLELTGNSLIIHGQTSRGFVEMSFRLQDLEVIAIGAPLNRAERFFDKLNQLGVPRTSMIGVTKDLKAGRLLIRDNQGKDAVFHFVDKIFDPEDFSAMIAELIRRGVKVESAG